MHSHLSIKSKILRGLVNWKKKKKRVVFYVFIFSAGQTTKKLVWPNNLYSVFIFSILKVGFEYKK